MVETTTEIKIKKVRSDNDLEYVSHHIENFLKQEGIKHKLTVEYKPQQYGVAERNGSMHYDPVRTPLHFGLKRF